MEFNREKFESHVEKICARLKMDPSKSEEYRKGYLASCGDILDFFIAEYDALFNNLKKDLVGVDFKEVKLETPSLCDSCKKVPNESCDAGYTLTREPKDYALGLDSGAVLS